MITKLQYDFRRPIMPSGDHLTVMLPVKGGAAEINQTNFSVFNFPHVFPLQRYKCQFFWR